LTALSLVTAAATATVGFALLGYPSLTGEKGEMQHAVHELDVAQHDAGLVRNGMLRFVSQLSLSLAELDAETTAGVKSALARNDDDDADRLVQAATIVAPSDAREARQEPAPLPPAPQAPAPGPLSRRPAEPTAASAAPPARAVTPAKLTPDQKQAILHDEADLYRLNLWDCMAEDGDIVQVLLDGRPYVSVRLRHVPSTVLVPISRSGATTIAIKGVFDGGGGITTGLRSDGGDIVLRSLRVGEVVSLKAPAPKAPGP
jgi:hypothetical protein